VAAVLRRSLVIAAVMSLLYCLGVVGFADQGGTRNAKNLELFSTGQPGSGATPAKVWTNKAHGEYFKEGEPIILTLQVAQPASLCVIVATGDGHVALIPQRSVLEEEQLKPGKIYTLFGDDSPLQLAAEKGLAPGKLVILLTGRPVNVDQFKPSNDKGFVSIPVDSQRELAVLRDEIKTLAEDSGFNRIVVDIPAGDGTSGQVSLVIQAREDTKDARKALPRAIESVEPETVTGSAGMKPLKEEGRR
jgi:hypothetical protein